MPLRRQLSQELGYEQADARFGRTTEKLVGILKHQCGIPRHPGVDAATADAINELFQSHGHLHETTDLPQLRVTMEVEVTAPAGDWVAWLTTL